MRARVVQLERVVIVPVRRRGGQVGPTVLLCLPDNGGGAPAVLARAIHVGEVRQITYDAAKVERLLARGIDHDTAIERSIMSPRQLRASAMAARPQQPTKPDPKTKKGKRGTP